MPAAAAAMALGYVLLPRDICNGGGELLKASRARSAGGGVASGRPASATPGMAVILLTSLSIALAMIRCCCAGSPPPAIRRRLAHSGFVLFPRFLQIKPAVLEMTSIDVGQGDSILLYS